MTDPFAEAYESALLVIEKLAEIDPKADSPEGRLLIGLATAVEEYEKERWQSPVEPLPADEPDG